MDNLTKIYSIVWVKAIFTIMKDTIMTKMDLITWEDFTINKDYIFNLMELLTCK